MALTIWGSNSVRISLITADTFVTISKYVNSLALFCFPTGMLFSALPAHNCIKIRSMLCMFLQVETWFQEILEFVHQEESDLLRVLHPAMPIASAPSTAEVITCHCQWTISMIGSMLVLYIRSS